MKRGIPSSIAASLGGYGPGDASTSELCSDAGNPDESSALRHRSGHVAESVRAPGSAREAPSQRELLEALEAACFVLRNVTDGDEDGHAALELVELVLERSGFRVVDHQRPDPARDSLNPPPGDEL